MIYKRAKKTMRSCFYIVSSALFEKKDILIYISYSKDVFSNMNSLYNTFLSDGVQVKRIYNKASFWGKLQNIIALAKARIIITDVSSLYAELSIHAKTKIIQCWHAGGVYKCAGYDTKRLGINPEQEEKNIMKKLKQISYFITSSPFIEDVFMQAFQLKAEQIKPLGLPRTDLLYTTPKKIRHDEKICVMYAPTFRNENKNRSVPCLFDFHTLQEKLGDEFALAFRAHPTSPYTKQSGYTDFSGKSYLETLQSADILITDYSSIFFDFLYFNKPVLIYIPDYDEYTTKHRKLYLHPEQLFPHSVCYTFESLVSKIREYAKKTVDYSHLWDFYMSACDGNSSQKIVNFIKGI